jgi:hypothetical protein
VGLAKAVLRSPARWVEALRAAWALRSLTWFSQAPYLPLPDRTYLRWRSLTAYGDSSALVPRADLMLYLKWRAAYRRSRKRSNR